MLIKEELSCYILQKNRIGFPFLGGGGLLKTFQINHQLLTQPYTTEQQGGRSAVYIEVLIMELAAAGWLTHLWPLLQMSRQPLQRRMRKKISHKVATGQLDPELVAKWVTTLDRNHKVCSFYVTRPRLFINSGLWCLSMTRELANVMKLTVDMSACHLTDWNKSEMQGI